MRKGFDGRYGSQGETRKGKQKAFNPYKPAGTSGSSSSPDTSLHSEEQSSSEPSSGVDPVTIGSLNASWYEVGHIRDASSVPLPHGNGPWAQWVNDEIDKYISKYSGRNLTDDIIRTNMKKGLNKRQLDAYIKEQTGSIIDQVNTKTEHKRLL